MTVDEIYGQMAETFRTETGAALAGDGDLAVRLYAVAAQIHALYVQAEWVQRQCFPQTAGDTFLDMHAQLRGLERREAVPAEGVLRFETDSPAEADLLIPAGTVCMTAAQARFQTSEDATLSAGATWVDAPAVALEPGSQGNVAAGAVRAMSVSPVGISRCTNPAPFAGGLDRESDEELRERVLETYQRMPNGANAAFYQQGAMTFPQVAAATVIPRPRGVGTVDVVVATPAGVPDGELLSEIQAYFEQRREIAVDVTVRAPEVVEVDVTAAVAAAENRDAAAVRETVEGALRAWFDGRLLGKRVLRAELGRIIFDVEGVSNYALSAPAADVDIAVDQLPVLGTLTVTALEDET